MVSPGVLLHLQYGSVPVKPPPTWHVYGAGEPYSVSMLAQVDTTLHDDATAIVWSGQAVVSCVAPLVFVSVNPVEQRHTGAVPDHAIGGPPWHVQVETSDGEVSSAALQAVVTVQLDPTAIEAQAATVWVAPLAFVSVRALHRHVGGVPEKAPVTWHVHVDDAAGVTVDPAPHAVVTVHVPVTAMALAPHAVVV